MDYASFPVGDLLSRPGSTRDVDLEAPVAITTDAVRIDAPATGVLRLDAAAGALVARGKVEVHGRATCVRCLVDLGLVVTAEVIATFGNPEDEDAYPITSDRRIDLVTPTLEELAMAVPVAPLCRADCRGLCATCGTDLNGEPCDGHEDLSSSPFADLERLFPPE